MSINGWIEARGGATLIGDDDDSDDRKNFKNRLSSRLLLDWGLD